jgi:heme-degrading monooxygenase HmoA
MKIITEIVSFDSKSEITENDFIEIIHRLETDFHSEQPGFIDTTLLHAEGTNNWGMIQRWDSLENLKKSSSNMFKNSKTEVFRNSIEPKSISIKIYNNIKIWTKIIQ